MTHDQTEAMTMASRLVVMKDGLIQQVGTPKEVYDTPENIFVGGFIGSPAMNFFTGTLQDNYFHMENTRFKVPDGQLKTLKQKGYNGQKLYWVFVLKTFVMNQSFFNLLLNPQSKLQ